MGSAVALSPDGCWFLYTQNDAAGADIVMLDNLREPLLLSRLLATPAGEGEEDGNEV